VCAPKIIGSKLAADTIVLAHGVSEVGRCLAGVEALLKGSVDPAGTRILAVVGVERCESHLPRRGKGSLPL